MAQGCTPVERKMAWGLGQGKGASDLSLAWSLWGWLLWLAVAWLRSEGAATQGKEEVDLQVEKGREKEGINFRIREIC